MITQSARWLVGSEWKLITPSQATTRFRMIMPQPIILLMISSKARIRQPKSVLAVCQWPPRRLQYLDLVWDNYLSTYGTEIPVDVWNVHIYILQNVNGFNHSLSWQYRTGHGSFVRQTKPWGPVAAR